MNCLSVSQETTFLFCFIFTLWTLMSWEHHISYLWLVAVLPSVEVLKRLLILAINISGSIPKWKEDAGNPEQKWLPNTPPIWWPQLQHLNIWSLEQRRSIAFKWSHNCHQSKHCTHTHTHYTHTKHSTQFKMRNYINFLTLHAGASLLTYVFNKFALLLGEAQLCLPYVCL